MSGQTTLLVILVLAALVAQTSGVPRLSRSGLEEGQGLCVEGPFTYEEGTKFPSIDGCNTCTCGPNGHKDCTDMLCNVIPSDFTAP